MWWLFTTLMRYPRGIYDGPLAGLFGKFFTFVVPALIVVNVPAETLAKFKEALNPPFIAWMLVATVAMLLFSRRIFRRALQSYRSASS
jgi:ABC-2 type transport system permease protein